jgi:hypothetical protein
MDVRATDKAAIGQLMERYRARRPRQRERGARRWGGRRAECRAQRRRRWRWYEARVSRRDSNLVFDILLGHLNLFAYFIYNCLLPLSAGDTSLGIAPKARDRRLHERALILKTVQIVCPCIQCCVCRFTAQFRLQIHPFLQLSWLILCLFTVSQPTLNLRVTR